MNIIKNEKTWIYASLALAVLFLVLFMVRFSTPSDTWACTNNQWIRNGNPITAVSSSECK